MNSAENQYSFINKLNKMKQIKLAIIGAYPYNGNRGVGALTYSTLFLLKKVASTKNIKINIILINSGFEKVNDQLEIGSDTIKFINTIPIDLFDIKGLLKLFMFPKSLKTLKEIRNVDYFLNIGAGDSFSDIYGRSRFHMFNNQNRLAFFFNKRLIFLPQTIGPFKDGVIKKKAIKSIEKANHVFARDFQSSNYVLNNTSQKNITESIDVAFFMPYERQNFSNNYIHVGLNISSLLWNGGYTRNNQFGLKCNYQSLIRNIIHYFLAIPNVKIHIVPHVVGADLHIENDYEVSYKLVNEYKNEDIILSPFFLTPIFAKNYIASLDFFMGARMHATIAAFSSGVPVYPMAYSRKFNGLFKDTLNYKYMGDMISEDMEVMLSGIKNAFEDRNNLASIIDSRLNTVVKEREKQLLEKLSDILKLN